MKDGIMTLHRYACVILLEQGGSNMNHVFELSFELSNEQYEKIAAYAEQREQTPEDLFHIWVDEMIHQVEMSNHHDSLEQENEKELLAKHPILQISGMFAIDEPGWSDRHDEYLAEAYADDHADE
jgi:hypothetical protein